MTIYYKIEQSFEDDDITYVFITKNSTKHQHEKLRGTCVSCVHFIIGRLVGLFTFELQFSKTI